MNNEKPLKKVIENMLEIYQLKGKINEVRIVNAWATAVGPMVNRHTDKLFVKNKRLYVYLTSSVIKNELVFARTEIIKRLNEAVGENVIEELVVK
ncbi:MAG TPA: DUF721 domain-containing protein [Bacteroidia bacterium]|nr:DUF721 domain-containing protein [Bacteroidia bacterium]